MNMKPTPSGILLRWMTAAIVSVAFQIAVAGNGAESILNLDRPIVIGHRGYKAFAPENTMPGFELAVSSGCDLIELDVHFSRDRKPIVIHDKTLDRTTTVNREWGAENVEVKTRMADEMMGLDAGSWFHPRYANTGLPELSEVLNYLNDRDSVTLIDRKAGTAEEYLEILEGLNLKESVIIQAFDWDFLGEVNRLDGDLILSAAGPPRTWKGKRLSTEERELDKDWIEAARKSGVRALAWNEQVSREALEYAHKHNIKVWVYTINSEHTARALIDLGIDGVITDNPAIIWKAFYSHSMGLDQDIR